MANVTHDSTVGVIGQTFSKNRLSSSAFPRYKHKKPDDSPKRIVGCNSDRDRKRAVAQLFKMTGQDEGGTLKPVYKILTQKGRDCNSLIFFYGSLSAVRVAAAEQPGRILDPARG